MDRFDLISPTDFRYAPPTGELGRRLGAHLSETATVRYQARVEAALMAVLEARGIAPKGAAEALARAAEEVAPQEVYDEERRVGHNIRALVHCLRKRVDGKFHAFIHLFATSADIMDTARAWALRDATDGVLLPALAAVEDRLVALATAHAGTVQIGRTHGQHAEPTTFGYAIALYAYRLMDRIELVHRTGHALPGKLSGAVGTCAAAALAAPDDPEGIERDLLARLGLPGCPASSQIVPPEPLTDYVHAVVSTFSVLAGLADDVRHLMRSEIAEIAPVVGAETVGSSTMPHKINPVAFENVKSLWKEFMPRMVTRYMDQLSEHQRDLTNSASMRYVPEVAAALAAAAERMAKALGEMRPDAARMEAAVRAAGEQAVAEPLYTVLAARGDAEGYERVRKLSREARAGGPPLLERAREVPEVGRALATLRPHERAAIEDVRRYVGAAPARAARAQEAWRAKRAELAGSCAALGAALTGGTRRPR